MADDASDIVSSRQRIALQQQLLQGSSSSEQQKSNKQDLLDARRKIETASEEHIEFGEVVRQGLGVVRRALDKFGAPSGEASLAISFNGGKDACVVLYLLLLVLAERDQLHRLSAEPRQDKAST